MADADFWAELIAPFSDDKPCGDDLEASANKISSLNRRGVIGQQTGIRDPNFDWRALKAEALELFSITRDLRPLPYLAAASLRIDGLYPVLELLHVAKSWLGSYPDQVHPQPESDFNPRINALADWNDPFAILDGIRRAPFLDEATVGTISLRSWQIAHGNSAKGAVNDKAVPDQKSLNSILSHISEEKISHGLGCIRRAINDARTIERLALGSESDTESCELAPLHSVLSDIEEVLAEELSRRGGVQPSVGKESVTGESSSSRVISVNSNRANGNGNAFISSRSEAIAALDAVSAYFTESEPSSPVPLLVQRAKRLINMSFLQVLDDLVPNSVDEAKKASGVSTRGN